MACGPSPECTDLPLVRLPCSSGLARRQTTQVARLGHLAENHCAMPSSASSINALAMALR